MLFKKKFICPGPTSVPSFSLREMLNPIIHHRTDEFANLHLKIINNLKKIYQTQNDLFIIHGSGTASMEAAVVNCLNSKKPVIVIRKGVFSKRWGKLCEAFGIPVIYFDIDYGKNICFEKFEKCLKENKNIQAVLTLYSETSTGALYDIKTIASLTQKYSDALVLVDAITGMLVHPCFTDDWGLDVVLSSSQKSYMCSPGISFLSFSKKAWKFFSMSNLPKFYFNLEREKQQQEKGFTSWTPPIHIFFALSKNLEWILSYSLNEWVDHYKELANVFRLGIENLGLSIFPENPSNALTAICLPKNFSVNEVVKKLLDDYNIKVSKGYPLESIDVIRVGHIGYSDLNDLFIFFYAFERILKEMGYPLKLGQSLSFIQSQI